MNTRRCSRLAPFACVALITGAVIAQDAGDAFNVAETRATLSEWVKTKQLISKERQKSKQDIQMLNARLALAEQRLKRIGEQLQETKDKIEQAGQAQQELVAEKETLEQALAVLEQQIPTLETRTRALLARSPEPLKHKVATLSQLLPENPTDTKRSIAERYQNVIGILSAMNSFNNELLVTTEVRDIGDGESVEVNVMYVGLGQAYFCNENGTIGGTGHPGDDGWQWQRQDDLAPTISAAIARYRNEMPASYDVLPVKLTQAKE